MIIVTGAAGFIGSNIVCELLDRGYKDVICVDLPGELEKSIYYQHFDNIRFLDYDKLSKFISENHHFIQYIIHMGANSDTSNPDREVYVKYNLNYSIQVWNDCVEYGLPLIYASSAATYGDGSLGYDDAHNLVENLQPLNHYGWSKNEFDKFALTSKEKPFYWSGLKFFNVFGPNENHKNGMSSVVAKAFKDITKTKGTRLFRSHRMEYMDGYQTRDFIYVKDVCDVVIFLMENRPESGIFNVGTGNSRTFLDLAKGTFAAMDVKPNISFVDTPLNLRDKYQYYTEANIDKLRALGYDNTFYTLEEGINEYVQSYLIKNRCNLPCLEEAVH